MKQNKLRAAILGFGGMGHCHGSTYASQKACELVAVCDIDKAKLDQAETSLNLGATGKTDLSKLRKYLSYEELVANEKLDFIDICLPSYLHAEYAVRAMKDGFNVLCEKPMALNVRDCDRLVEVSRATGRLYMIAQCLRFSTGYRFMRDACLKGKYGRLLRIVMHRVGGLPGGWYRDEKLSGGVLMDLHIHDIDWLLSVLGTPDSVVCFGAATRTPGIDDIVANYIYNGRFTVSAESSWTREGFRADMSAMFEKGTLEFLNGKIRLLRKDKPAKEVLGAGNNPYAAEIDYFARCVKAGRKPELCTPESTRETVRIIGEIIRSAKAGGRKVPLKGAK